ncbi:Alpha/beta hydrolase fold-3 [Pleurostoma richardsiae]|uniref:Alpha/beta hydrolase fold-3 n=1 Tax=Pleurostoma richardsiae TaxID=41990 RepID=A0AA38RGB8_9PEZI|nr:Alpha/beta hydrolase fold-3 [Pleurostoma richardsiae]
MASLLPRFERHELVYKTMNDVPFHVSTLVPKGIAFAKMTCPVLVHFHGGGLINGVTLEPAFLATWMLQLAESEDAIIVDPAYRLLPEVNGTDVLQDIEDFWSWVHASLPAALTSKHLGLTVDLDRIAVCGESAGGYLSLQSALLFPQAKIRIVMAQFPSMYPDLEAYNPRLECATAEEDKLLTDYMVTHKGEIRIGSKFPWRTDLMSGMFNTGRHREMLGDDPRLTLGHPLRLSKTIPPVWIAQGVDDSITPKPGTDQMVDMIRDVHPEVPLLYSIQPGDHGFDRGHGLSEPWVAEAMAFVRKYWP